MAYGDMVRFHNWTDPPLGVSQLASRAQPRHRGRVDRNILGKPSSGQVGDGASLKGSRPPPSQDSTFAQMCSLE